MLVGRPEGVLLTKSSLYKTGIRNFTISKRNGFCSSHSERFEVASSNLLYKMIQKERFSVQYRQNFYIVTGVRDSWNRFYYVLFLCNILCSCRTTTQKLRTLHKCGLVGCYLMHVLIPCVITWGISLVLVQ